MDWYMAMACDCDRTGSASGVCHVTTGQCPCLTNVAREGEITRAGGVEGKLCTTCKENHFGFSSGAGCTACGCNNQGSLAQQCDQNGQCPCKETITGLNCGVCMPNYYLFSVTGCLPCNCTSDGVSSPDCDKDSGVCPCRTNTMGDKCDQCKPGYFNLQPSNPHGCQKCFCYEHGTTCLSAQGFVEDFIFSSSTQSWAPAAFDSAYVMAPAVFLGNQAYSYNQDFSVEMQSQSADVDLSHRLPVIIESQGVQLNARLTDVVNSLGRTSLSIPLHEDYWFVSNGTQATAQQMQRVLADVQAIYIQQFYDPVTVVIRNVGMRTAAEALVGDTRTPVTYVEECACEPSNNVAGLSCQSCTEGNRRPTATATPFDGCMACDCNGKQEQGASIICDEVTGSCLNCRNGTTGDNCELCAANVVTSPECNTCQDTFWGLFAEGCVACDCSPVGASGESCAQDTGQCTCVADTVTGRTCDICKDNYFDLTNAGCKVCDACYTLVEAEVNDLRQKRMNLTDYVQVLQNNDNNTALGPFRQRLSQAEADLAKLQQFLIDARSMETASAGTLIDLNDTLTRLVADLDGDPALLSIIQAELGRAQTSLEVSQTASTQISATVNSALAQFEALRLETTKITNLANGLVDVNNQFSSLAGATVNELQNLENEVVMIESVVADAKNVSGLALQTATETSNALGALTSRIASLQTSANQLSDLTRTINSSVATTLTRVTDKTNSMTSVNQQVADLVVPSESVPTGLQTRASQVGQSAQSLLDQAVTSAQSTTLTNDVSTAVSQSADLLSRARTALGQSDALLEQVTGAAALAAEAQTSAAAAFTAAEDMLNTLSNFNTIIADLQQQTQNALATVMQVRNLSQSAIEASQALRDALSTTFNNAELALQQFTTAETLQRSKRDGLQPVSQQAVQLQTDSSQVLTDLDAQAARLDIANNTYVQVGAATCNSEPPLVVATRTNSDAAKLKADEAATKVSATRDRAQSLLLSLTNLQEIDVARIQQLKTDIDAHRTSFDSKQLAAVVAQLRTKLLERQVWITGATDRKLQLQLDIDRLKTTQGQLVHSGN